MSKVLSNLRYSIPLIFGFEDCNILTLDKYESGNYYAVSPNVYSVNLKKSDKLSLYFYSIEGSLCEKVASSGTMMIVKNPREADNFIDGVDNLTPLVNLKEIAFIDMNLGGDKGSMGVIQLMNKVGGFINECEKVSSTSYSFK